MSKISTVLILIVIIALGGAPFFLTSTTNETISVGSSLIGALASLVTLIIALVLYSKYGVEKSLLNKQTDVVFRLITQLKKTNFMMEMEEGHGLFLRLDRLKGEYWDDYKEKKLLFNFNYAEGLNNIWEITEDVFLPSNIVDKINPLIVQSIDGIDAIEEKQYMRVSVLGHTRKAKDDKFGVLNSKQMSLEEFVAHWENVIDISKKWLKEHSNMSVDLNFERR